MIVHKWSDKEPASSPCKWALLVYGPALYSARPPIFETLSIHRTTRLTGPWRGANPIAATAA